MNKLKTRHASSPHKRPGLYRTNAYSVRYNDAERDDVEAAANLAALDVGSWVRMVSVAAARKGTDR